MTEYLIIDQLTKRRFICHAGENVLKAMERHSLQTIAVGCRGGGCGVCRVRVHAGTYECGRMSKAQVSNEQQIQGYALACRLHPTSDLVLESSPSPMAIKGVTATAKAKQPHIEVIK